MSGESNEKDLSCRLKRALSTGDVTAFRRLVKGGVDVNSKYWFDSTLLHEAVAIGKEDIVSILLQYKAKVNAQNKDGRTALHIASRAGKLEIVSRLLKAGAAVNQQTVDGQTALHIAVWKRQYEIAEKLLNFGARIDICDKDGWLPIHWAAKKNSLRAVKMLMKRESSLDCMMTKAKTSPFQLAVLNGDPDLVGYLVLHGADVQATVQGKSAGYCIAKNSQLSEQEIMDIVDIFIENGYIIQNDDWFRPEKLPEKLTNHSGFQQWLQNRKNSIQSLCCLTRSKIRRHLNMCTCGRSIISKIKQIPLPSLLIDFVMFSERLYNMDSTLFLSQNDQDCICIDDT